MSGESVTFKIGADTTNFKRGMDQATKHLNTIKAKAAETSNAFAQMGVALSGAAIGAHLAHVTKEFARVQDLADRFRTTSTSIQKVGQASRQAGTDIETVAKAMSKLTIEAQKGGNISELMQELGINTERFLSMDMEGKMLALADAYAKTGGDVEATARFMEVLGTKAQDLLPLLEQGGDSLRRTFEETKVASEEAVRAAAELDDRWTAAMDSMKVKTLEFLDLARSIPAALGEMNAGGGNDLDTSDAANRGNDIDFLNAKIARRQKAGRDASALIRQRDAMLGEIGGATPVQGTSTKAPDTTSATQHLLGPIDLARQKQIAEEAAKAYEHLNKVKEKAYELETESLEANERLNRLLGQREELESKTLTTDQEIYENEVQRLELNKEIAATKKEIAEDEKRAADEAERNAEALAAQNREIQARKTGNLENLATRGPGRFSGTQAAARRALAMQEEAQDRFARGDVIGGQALIDKANQTSVKLAENIAARGVTDNQVRDEARRRAREGSPMSEQAVREELRREASQRAKDALNGTLDKSADSKQADREAKESKERQTSTDPQKNSLESIVKNILQEIKDRLPQHALT